MEWELALHGLQTAIGVQLIIFLFQLCYMITIDKRQRDTVTFCVSDQLILYLNTGQRFH